MKNIAKKLLLLALAAFMIVTALVACNKTPENTPDESDPIEESSSEEPIETEPPVEDTTVFENGAVKYKVVRPQSASKEEIDATTALVKALKEKTGKEVMASDDWVNETLGYTESEFEILIGRTNRKESDKVYSGLRLDDYAVSIVGKKIVIAAYDAQKLNEAVSYFLEKLTDAEGNIQFLAADSMIKKADYEVGEITVGGKELSGFKIVYKGGASENVKNAALAISEKLREYRYNVPVVMDSVEESACEIIVCDTNRGASKEENDKLLSYDYRVYLEGTKLYVLAGTHADAVNGAVEALSAKLEELLKDGSVVLDESNAKAEFFSDVYKTKQLLLNGTDIKEYTVVYAHNDTLSMKLADRFCDVVEKVCGRRLNIVSDSRAYSGDKEIIVGYSSKRLTSAASAVMPYVADIGDNDYLLFGEGDFFFAGGKENQNSALTAAMNILTDAILNVSDPECSEISFDLRNGEKVNGSKYSIMTYNDGDNSYQNIDDRMAIVKEYMPDIICFQETQTPHARGYKSKLGAYDYVLYDNDGTTFNSQPIFWKKDKFDLVDSGIKWLSDTPDKRSKYSDSDYTRSFTYAILKDKETGEEIVIISTHTDYVQSAVVKQTARLMELTAEFRDKPMLILGDFNMRDTSDAYANISKECFMDSGRYVKAPSPATIDFCFVDITKVVPVSYKVIDDHELSKVASDHYPVYTEFYTGFHN